jgi:bile acid:Na+ symporter, BASS family
MSVDRLISVLVTITLIEMMIGTGVGVTFSEIGGVARNWALLLRAAVANYICVPVLVIALLLLFHSPPMIAAGFLIVAVCPGAPYGPPFTALAKGTMPLAVGLMVILAASSAIAAPLLLRLLLPFIARGPGLTVNATRLMRTLLTSQLLPLGSGLMLRRLRPKLAEKLKRPIDRMSLASNLCVFGLILAVYFRTLAAIRLMAFAGMFVLVMSSLLIGWLVAESGGEDRKAMSFSTAVRNIAVTLVIATDSFADSPAVTAALAYGLFQTIVLAIVALAWGRLASKTAKPVAQVSALLRSTNGRMAGQNRA